MGPLSSLSQTHHSAYFFFFNLIGRSGDWSINIAFDGLETAQQLGSLTPRAEDPDSVPNAPVVSHNCL